jgi:hypothetical protein
MTMFFTPKRHGTGNGRVLAIDSIKNQQGSIFNKFVAGSGVGATSTFARRAKIQNAAARRQTFSLTNCVYKIIA